MLEGTQTKPPVDSEREAMILEMLRDANKVEIPSELRKNPVISRGEETGAPTILKEINSAGYVYIWDSRTGEKVPVIYYRLGQVLRERRPDGSYRFTTLDPRIMPKKGSVKCMLHSEGASRGHYDELGFRTCGKANLINQYQLRRHMMLKHSQEWKAIEEERTAKEKDEDRALQRLLLANQLGKLEGANNKMVEVTSQMETTASAVSFTCPKCDKEFKYKKAYKTHIKTCN